MVRKTFMSQWINFCQYFQVFFLICVIVNLMVITGLLFAEKLYLDPREVYQNHVKENEEYFRESNQTPPSLNELAILSIVFRLVIICVVPASMYIYRSRLVTLDAFLTIKKDRGSKQGNSIVYNRSAHFMHIFFLCSRQRKLNYVEYVQFRNLKRDEYEVTGDYATVAVIFLIVFFYLWNETIDEFKLPWYYIFLICLLLAQKQVTFVIKMFFFFPVYAACRCYDNMISNRYEN